MPVPFGNRILDTLPEVESAALRTHLRRVELRPKQMLYEAGDRIETVYFPSGAVLSAVAVMRDGSGVEVGTFGREGHSGTQLVLGSARASQRTICQVAGGAHALGAGVFLERFASARTFRTIVRRYAEALFNFMGQSIACNRLHGVSQRCARWLLLTNDRAARDEFDLSHELLATMLGVHRPVVSVAAGALQEAGLIRYRRAHVRICDRRGLESASCECYRLGADEFDRCFDVAHANGDVREAGRV